MIRAGFVPGEGRDPVGLVPGIADISQLSQRPRDNGSKAPALVQSAPSPNDAGSAWEESSQFENNYFTEMCSGSEAGSYLRLIDFVYLSTLGLRVIKKKRRGRRPARLPGAAHVTETYRATSLIRNGRHPSRLPGAAQQVTSPSSATGYEPITPARGRACHRNIQGYLAYKKPPPRRTLVEVAVQHDCQGPHMSQVMRPEFL